MRWGGSSFIHFTGFWYILDLSSAMTIPYENYPCPKCGQHSLIYDGMLVWRSGPRPPRALASKEVGFLPRADYERERLYHCAHCGAEFFEDVEQRGRVHLYEEHVAGRYTYDRATGVWRSESSGRGGHGSGLAGQESG